MADQPAKSKLHAPPDPERREGGMPQTFSPEGSQTDDPRLARLERMVKYQWAAILAAVVLVGGLLVWQIQSTAAEAARAHAQLKLLQQVQADFGRPDHTGQSPLTDAQLYHQLRVSLNKVRETYEPLKNFDLSHPNKNLDQLLGKADQSKPADAQDDGKQSAFQTQRPDKR